MTQVNIQQVSEQLHELIALASTGEDIVIMENNQPIVKLSAITLLKKQRQFGSAKGLVRVMDDFDEPLDDFAEYR